MNAKSKLFGRVLPELKAASPYFTTDAIARRVRELNLNIKPGTLPVYLTEATATGLIHDAGRGWYSRLKTPFVLDTRPVKELAELLQRGNPADHIQRHATGEFAIFATLRRRDFVLFPSLPDQPVDLRDDFIIGIRSLSSGCRAKYEPTCQANSQHAASSFEFVGHDVPFRQRLRCVSAFVIMPPVTKNQRAFVVCLDLVVHVNRAVATARF